MIPTAIPMLPMMNHLSHCRLQSSTVQVSAIRNIPEDAAQTIVSEIVIIGGLGGSAK